MKKIAFYSGLFDTSNRGHLNIVIRVLKAYPKIIIGVENTGACHFSLQERIQMVKDTIQDFLDLDYGPVQFRQEVARRIMEDPSIIKVVPIEGETVDAAILHNASVMVRGIRNEFDIHVEEELRNTILMQFRIRNYPLKSKDYILESTNAEVAHMSSSLSKHLCERGEYIQALHHVTPRVHNRMMSYYLKRPFQRYFSKQDKLWEKLNAIYGNRTCCNFTHVAYMLNRLHIELALKRIEQIPTSVVRAMFLRDVCDTPAESAVWVEKNISFSDVEEIKQCILAMDYSSVPTQLTDNQQLIVRCDLLLLTDEENYPLYRRIVRSQDCGKTKVPFYSNMADPMQYLEQTHLFSELELENAVFLHKKLFGSSK